MGLAYAGIGSRETPADALQRMREIAAMLGDEGWCLRSGGAEGADTAFEQGLSAHHEREIYLPWKGFGGHGSALCKPSPEAFTLAASMHPAWVRCSRGARSLHARNCQQVLGRDLDDPVTMVVCWTKHGSGAGGTGQALRIAAQHAIPVFDLGISLDLADEAIAFADAQRAARRPER